MTKFKLINLAVLFISFVSLISSCRTMVNHEENDIWHQRLSNIKNLNQYIKENENTLFIKNLELEKYKLQDVIAKEVIIDNSDLKIVRAKKINLKRLTIKNSILEKVDFAGSVIDELVIENSNLLKFNCYGCFIKKIIIDKSRITDSKMSAKENEKTEISNSFISDSSFSGSEIKTLVIKNTNLDINEKYNYFRFLKSDLVTITDSKVRVSFDKSEIKKIQLNNLSGTVITFKGIKGGNLHIVDSDIEAFSVTGVDNFLSKNSRFWGSIRIFNSGKASLKNCSGKLGYLSIADTNLDQIDINNCDLGGLHLWLTNINRLEIKNSKITVPAKNSDMIKDAQKMKIGALILENVTLDTPFDFKDAIIENLQIINLKKGKNFKIINPGKNFTF